MEIINQNKQIEPLTFKCCNCEKSFDTKYYEIPDCIITKDYATVHCPFCGVLCVKKIGKVMK